MSNRARVIAGSALVLLGLLFALLPKEWIEERFGFEPDAGNGLVELALIVIPVVIGAALLIGVLLARAASRGGTRTVEPES
jgi:hypothetical protein